MAYEPQDVLLFQTRQSLELTEYLYREEESFNSELIGLLQKALPYIPNKEEALIEKIKGYIRAQDV